MGEPEESTFRSSKEAVAFALSHRRGPQLRRSTLGRSPQGGFRDPWDASLVRACLAKAGVAPDSPEERELDDWARGRGPKPTSIERAVRRALDDAGLLARPETTLTARSAATHVEWEDPETGLPLHHLSLADTVKEQQ